jgi:hypothetical protein
LAVSGLEELEQHFEAAKEDTAVMTNLVESVVVPAIEEGTFGGLVGVDMVVAGAEVDGIPPAVPVPVAADPKAEKVTTNAALVINKSVQPRDKVENHKLVVQKGVVVEVVDGEASQPLDAEAEAGLSLEDRAAIGLDDPRPSAVTPAAETVVPPRVTVVTATWWWSQRRLVASWERWCCWALRGWCYDAT